METKTNRLMMLSRVLVYVFAAVILVLDVYGWRICRWIASFDLTPRSQAGNLWLYVGLMSCSVPAYAVLYLLNRLLRNLSGGKVFTPENVRLIRQISLWCFAAAVPCGICAVKFWSLGILAVAAAFMGLIVRIVADAFDQAVGMRDELDLTV